MATNANTPENWSDPSTCPFCGDELRTPGAGFVEHIAEAPACENGFEIWRENLDGDLKGGWSG